MGNTRPLTAIYGQYCCQVIIQVANLSLSRGTWCGKSGMDKAEEIEMTGDIRPGLWFPSQITHAIWIKKVVESNKAMSLILVELLDVCVWDHTSVLSRHIFIFTKVVRMK